MRSRRRAFTLVELLVVIGIIAVLIALLMPALSKVRKHAQEVHCAANLRSIGQALTMYTQQYGCYPGCWIYDGTATALGVNQAVWPVRLRPFLGGEQGVFLCPARDARFEWPKVPPEPGGRGRAGALHVQYGYELGEPLLSSVNRRFSYGYNAVGTNSGFDCRGLGWQVNTIDGAAPASHPGWWHERRMSRVRSPAQMIGVADSNGDEVEDYVIRAVRGGSTPGDPHRGGANVLFCDGHVQWHGLKDLLISQPEFDPRDERVRRMWNSDNEP